MAPLFITVVLVRVRGSYTHSANTPVRVAPVQVLYGPNLSSYQNTAGEEGAPLLVVAPFMDVIRLLNHSASIA